MPTGSCYCGQAKISYSGEPIRSGLCHCNECKKYTSSAFSINLLISNTAFQTSGTFKSFSKIADSGKKISTFFCLECGSSMYREGPTFEGQKVIQAGVLDKKEVVDGLKLEVELFAPLRVCWVRKLEATVDREGMN